MKWIVTAAREQNGPRDAKMHNKLAKEFIDAYNNEVGSKRFVFGGGFAFYLPPPPPPPYADREPV